MHLFIMVSMASIVFFISSLSSSQLYDELVYGFTPAAAGEGKLPFYWHVKKGMHRASSSLPHMGQTSMMSMSECLWWMLRVLE
jgi:hypothetical protein